MKETGQLTFPSIQDFCLLHACAQRGVKIRLEFQELPPLALLRELLLELHVYETGSTGFFRGKLGRWVTVTGIPEKNHITLQFSLIFRERALEDLAALIPDFQEEYSLGMMYLEERRNREAL